jgi:tartrate-resistant acid phosphatase type 5
MALARILVSAAKFGFAARRGSGLEQRPGLRACERLELRCLLAAPQFLAGVIRGNVEAPELVEASGLIASRQHGDVLWTHNDNGDSRLFAMTARGKHLGIYDTQMPAVDWEDLAIGPGPQIGVDYIYVADTGDNAQIRSTVTVYRVPEPTVRSAQSPVNVNLSDVAAVSLRYPDGAHDAESLIVDPDTGDIYVITKRDTPSRIYRAAYPQSTSTTTTLEFLGQLTWGGALSGDISPDGREILLKDFDDAFYYSRPAGTSIAAALSAPPESIPYTTQQLGEGISWDGQGRGYFTNSEGTHEPLYYYARVTGSPETIEFAVIGDYGADGPAEAAVAGLVASWDPNLIVTVGDNNYDVGAAATIDQNIGKHYQQFIGDYRGGYGPGSTINRFYPALGNHDWATANAQPYLDYFTLPGNERYYDFVRGPVHFFAIDSDPNEPDDRTSTSAQAAWLQSALAASVAPFQVVYFHHAPYSSGPHGSNTALQWPFEAWGADLVLAGHDHTYERLDIGDLTYVVNGLGGRSIYSFGTPVPGSQVRYNGNYGAMRVTADASAMTLQFYSVANGGTLIDSYTVSPGQSSGGNLIDAGSVWRYFDAGTDLGTSWRTIGYNDSNWASGPAQLGYGDGDEATTVSYGGDAANKHTTTYFRRAFTIDDPQQFSALELSLVRDDGAVVYLNGQEVARSNMPTGTVSFNTLAASAVGGASEATPISFAVDPQLLLAGTNVVAVEIHQASSTSSDISFDLALSAEVVAETPPKLLGHWMFDDGGTTATGDASGNGNNATLVGGASLIATDAGGLLSFDGVNDYARLDGGGASSPFALSKFTLATWFQRKGTGVNTGTGTGGVQAEPLITKGRGEADGDARDMNFFLGLAPRNGGWVLAADMEEHASGANPGLNHPVFGAATIDDNQWRHAAVTYDGGTWRLYLDGEADGSLTVGQPANFDSVQWAAIGSALNSSGSAAGAFLGWIDDARIYAGVLDDAGIAALFADGPPDSPGQSIPQVAVFQQGVAGYSGAADTMLQESGRGARGPDANHSSTTALSIDAKDPQNTNAKSMALLRFGNLIGGAAGQVPAGALIDSATLTLDIVSSGSGMSVHQMIRNWTVSDTWNTLANGISADGVEAVAAPVAVIGSGAAGATVGTGALMVDVTASVQAWVDGEANNGWALRWLEGGSNGLDFRSSEAVTASLRPKLTVNFRAPAESASAVIASVVDSEFGPPQVGARDAQDPVFATNQRTKTVRASSAFLSGQLVAAESERVVNASSDRPLGMRTARHAPRILSAVDRVLRDRLVEQL